MNELTIGQRIAARRKLQNLSQEALAEHLGISRQAVSKWEADAAIPEIDKLIALSKLYDVSVGWLLGVEELESARSDTLSETQLKMVEEIVKRYQVPQRKHTPWKTAVAVLCIVTFLALSFHHTQQRNDLLAAENDAIRNQIAELSADNSKIQNQIDKLDTLLNTQSETGKLLRSYVPLCTLNDDLTTVDITFYLTPRVYHENLTAYLSVFNPVTRYNEMLECRWSGDRYLVHVTLPLEDHYHYSFLLVSDTGYEEELLAESSYFTDLLIHSTFYIAEEHPKYAQMKTGQSTSIGTDETVYRYDAPLYMPCILEENGFVPFRDARITLLHNDTVIWEADYAEAFLALYQENNIESPLNPDIQIELPELQEHDRLILELTATTHTGRTLVTLLDDLTVTSP